MYMDRTYVQLHDKKSVHELGLDLWRECVVRRPSFACRAPPRCIGRGAGPTHRAPRRALLQVCAPRLKERLLQTLLDLVTRERSGEAVDRSLIKAITRMLTDLGRGCPPAAPPPAGAALRPRRHAAQAAVAAVQEAGLPGGV